ncbi:MAG: radical SAM family heme chaperone HemW [Deltaproteobacteria bacterium]|nr:radical SAM family heme chaperone HemW [Deltaproteobacteria bacterium]
MKAMAGKPAGIYVHIPFCVRKCPYCDFYSVADLSRIDSYVDALLHEMAFCEKPRVCPDTIYFGGGTPSILSSTMIGRIIDGAFRFFDMSDNVEVTLEVNPGTVDASRLSAFRDAGINRLIIGAQSFDDEKLNFLGRIHDGSEAKTAIREAGRAGFENIGIDLICGIPGREAGDWEKELKTALSFSLPHLSCYMLTIEPGTPLYSDMEDGRFSPVAENLAADLFEVTMEVLDRAGYDHYEISNFAKMPGFRSRHNCKYWTGAPYVGLGASAHSHVKGERYWNVRSADRYIARVSSGLSPVDGKERPDTDQQMIEAVYLGLRAAEGIDSRAFELRFGRACNEIFGREIATLSRHGLLESCDDNRICLTRQGKLKADAVAGRLIGCI